VVNHLTTHSALYLSLYHRFISLRSTLQTHILTPFLHTFIYPALLRLYNSPDILSVVLFAAVLLLSLKVLDMLRQAVMFWVRIVTRLLFWGTILVCGVYVWGRGVDGTVDDVRVYGGALMDLWTREYDKYDNMQKQAKVAAQMNGASRKGYKGR